MIKKLMTATFLLGALALAHPTFAEQASDNPPPEKPCKTAHRTYDESYMAYSEEFAEYNRLPKENIEEMPEYLHFVEFVIRSEFSQPVCYLNFAIDKNPQVFKIPKEDFQIRRHVSAVVKYFKDLKKGMSGYSIAKRTMWIELANPKNLMVYRTSVIPYSLSLLKKKVFVSALVGSCKPAYASENGVIQIESANAILTYEQARRANKQNEFYYNIKWPENLRKKLIPVLKEIDNTDFEINNCKKEVNQHPPKQDYLR